MSLKKNILLHFSVILVLYILAIGANFLGSYHPHYSAPNNMTAYSPPIKWHFNIHDGLYFQTRVNKLNQDTYKEETITGETKCKLSLFSKHGKHYNVLGIFNTNIHLLGSSNCPDQLNILGTDKLGRDYLSRLLHGLRPSLYTAIIGVSIAFPIGIVYGVLAACYRKTIGELMMRFVEVILSLPSLYLLVILAGILPASLSNFQRLIIITIILSFIGWAGLARVVRGQVLSILDREFVQYSQLINTPMLKLIFREIVPQLSSYLIITLTISFPGYVLGETALSFLGLGISQPDSSLGTLLSEGKDISNLFLRPWLAIIPSSIIILLAWNCNLLGDNLRNLFDPKQQ